MEERQDISSSSEEMSSSDEEGTSDTDGAGGAEIDVEETERPSTSGTAADTVSGVVVAAQGASASESTDAKNSATSDAARKPAIHIPVNRSADIQVVYPSSEMGSFLG